MLSTAHVLRACSTGGVWRSFAAMVVAVFDGWALKTVPNMERVLSAGIAAWQVEEHDLAFGLPDEDARPNGKWGALSRCRRGTRRPTDCASTNVPLPAGPIEPRGQSGIRRLRQPRAICQRLRPIGSVSRSDVRTHRRSSTPSAKPPGSRHVCVKDCRRG